LTDISAREYPSVRAAGPGGWHEPLSRGGVSEVVILFVEVLFEVVFEVVVQLLIEVVIQVFVFILVEVVQIVFLFALVLVGVASTKRFP
jgi:hypothetical protein